MLVQVSLYGQTNLTIYSGVEKGSLIRHSGFPDVDGNYQSKSFCFVVFSSIELIDSSTEDSHEVPDHRS